MAERVFKSMVGNTETLRPGRNLMMMTIKRVVLAAGCRANERSSGSRNFPALQASQYEDQYKKRQENACTGEY